MAILCQQYLNKLFLSSRGPLFLMYCIIPGALISGGVLAEFGLMAFTEVIGLGLLVLLIVLRWDALLVVVLIALHLYLDWYQGVHILVPLLALLLLPLFYLLRSASHPWIQPRWLWLWMFFLLLTIYPAIRGGMLMVYDAASFYPSDILGALLMYWLGMLVARNKDSLQLFFQLLTLLAVLLAVHTLFQSVTGTILFASSRVDTFLSRSDVAYYQMASTDTQRAGSFFIDPNWNGAFFALAFFLPLGLLVSGSRVWQKILYLLALILILLALLCTYSTGAWVAFLIGLIVFLMFIDSTTYRIIFLLIACGLAALIIFVFPTQIALQIQHASGNNELSLRIAAWQTAICVVQAYPWFGVGLGHQAYLIHSNMYRVPEQFVLLSHPHNSYLEWAAMAGIPVLGIFLVLVVTALYQGWQNWRQSKPHLQSLVGAGIAATITLSINSISINGWTHFALAMIIWPILGAIASPLLCTAVGDQITD